MRRMFPHLCEPIKIGNVELKSTMIAAPVIRMLCNGGHGGDCCATRG